MLSAVLGVDSLVFGMLACGWVVMGFGFVGRLVLGVGFLGIGFVEGMLISG